jgi:4-amino-4-deoxy-L-arabinose transferase-like glycosyltransferase
MNYSIIKDKYLWAILIIAIVVRLYSGFTTFVISTDAVQYIDQARNFVEGRFNRIDYSETVGFESSYHPLYSFLIAVLFQCINNYEISAKAVSIIMGVSLVTAVYVMGKRIFDSRIAFFCALILCFTLMLQDYLQRFCRNQRTYFSLLWQSAWDSLH